MQDQIADYAAKIGANLKSKSDVYELNKVIAERKAFLSKKKLTYTAKIKVDSNNKTMLFSEYLKESGSGISAGGDFDSNISPGFGFSKTTYKTGTDGISGSIEEQSNLFGKQYNYDFKYQQVREKVESLAKEFGYTFDYKIIPNF